MPQVLVRNIEQDVLKSLQERAQKHGRSLEAELRQILKEAAQAKSSQTTLQKVEEIRSLFAGRSFSDSAEILRQERDQR